MSDTLFYQGRKLRIELPSGKQVTVREQNGDDEGEFSKMSNQIEGSFISIYLNRVVEEDHDLKRKPLVEEIDDWKQRDRLYCLFYVRILSLGNEFKFSESKPSKVEGEEGPKQMFSVSLVDEYAQGYGEPNYVPKKYGIQKYPLGVAPYHEFSTSSGKTFRFDIFTGKMELETLEKMPREQQNKNTPLLIRNLRIYNKEEWVPVLTFGAFGAREMQELRSEVVKVDSPWEPLVEYSFEGDKTVYTRPLMGQDFFFPEMI